MKDIYEMTIGDLLEMGAGVNIDYHSRDSSEAVKKLSLFFDQSDQVFVKGDTTQWIKVNSDEGRLRVVSFFDKKS